MAFSWFFEKLCAIFTLQENSTAPSVKQISHSEAPRVKGSVHASEHFFKLENEIFGFRIGSSLAYVAVD